MIIKCKICGGDLQFTPGDTYGTCEYCGSVNTIPKGDDEQKLNLYNRANHFRRQGEFDKALAAYERLLEQDETDAEAHWGAVLSRYGIEYVEDPATKKRIPTCHRLQLTSILADEDYRAAIEYASDTDCRRLYEEQAAQIAEIQKGILAISQTEKPYDVFICYKEADENGRRTRDSQWAQEVYYGLTEQGYKVFFSRITLEDKLGQEYEPYIFAALNSTRVMIVIGSKPEYFNAVWVKNEWSRYLALMAGDHKRLLIPCYRDMDPYDLPDELSSLQSQDMSKIGFMQDLLRGVRKVLEADKATERPRAAQQVVQTAPVSTAPGVNSLLERAWLFIEDGDFDSAAEYLDRVLDIDPKYAPAYTAKVCVKLKLRKESDLAEADPSYENDPDWKKALRFANAQQKPVYEGYIENAQQKVAYNRAIQHLQYAHTSVDTLNKLVVTFESIRDYKDAQTLALKCRKEAEVLAEKQRKEAEAQRTTLYDTALSLIKEANNESATWSIIKQRLADPRLNNYRDVEQLRTEADKRYDELRISEKEANRLAAEKRREEEADAAAKKKRNSLIGIIAAAIVIAIIVLVTQKIIPENNYQAAVALQQAGKYEEAISAFTALGSYSNASTQITETKYLQAKAMNVDGDYAGAVAIFLEIRSYKDVDSLLKNDHNLSAAVAREANLTLYKTVGGHVTFGTYPQTSAGNDKTAIEWQVLDYDAANNRSLLISQYGLEAQPYNTTSADVTWEKCTLRTWLNSTFISEAFSASEQTAILKTIVDNSKNQGYSGYGISGGNKTQDRIFLLSYAEANKYFGVQHYSVSGSNNNTVSRVVPTTYAIIQGAYTSSSNKTADGSPTGWWWLRSPGIDQTYAAYVYNDGSLDYSSVSRGGGCVRPALWINLESDIF